LRLIFLSPSSDQVIELLYYLKDVTPLTNTIRALLINYRTF
jgi:hypothetical protein